VAGMEGLTRRRLVALGLVLPPVAALAGGRRLFDIADATAAPLVVTPQCDDGDDDDETLEQTEGPYYTPRTPRRRSLVTAGMAGTRLTITGYVLNTRCKPVKNALIDVWQCDAGGVYDNEGYRLRGHQFTDAMGRWRLDTIVPGVYPGRTRHIHVKVQAPNRPVLTTQLYFPGTPQNASDGIFDASLLLRRYRKAGAKRTARFDFVLDA
jgi:protocatechuate 3,4-dioxygenase beta subunit